MQLLHDHILSEWAAAQASFSERNFEYLGCGSFRYVFGRGNIVIKIPYDGEGLVIDGFIDNVIEARAWHKYRNNPTANGMRLAPCRLLSNGLLMMARVSFKDRPRCLDMPDWARQGDLGSEQVGMWKGELVAFDYALEIPERTKWEKEFGWAESWYQRNCKPRPWFKDAA